MVSEVRLKLYEKYFLIFNIGLNVKIIVVKLLNKNSTTIKYQNAMVLWIDNGVMRNNVDEQFFKSYIS